VTMPRHVSFTVTFTWCWESHVILQSLSHGVGNHM
jgi:hypothetical protein